MILQMGPMWVLAGLSGGWLAENLLRRGGYGLIIDMVLGLGGSLAGGWIVLALAPPSVGMLAMLAVGFAAAGSVIVVQRVCWRSVS
jgi:uncharacterized membrane protein YeaQ/YmgE (transglycosylase-associated protein family)